MAFEFKFPDVGEGIHEGEIVHWRVKLGDVVKEDQPLVEMETAKAIVELPSPRSGVILEVRGKEGTIIKVGDTLVVIGEKGETVAATPAATPSASGPGVIGEIPTDAGGIVLPPRRSEEPASASSRAGADEGPVERIAFKGVRKAVAAQMSKSASTIPHVTHMEEFDASALVKKREGEKAQAAQKGVKLTYLPYIMQALVEALKKYPAMNATLDETRQEIVYKKYYNIGMAVDTPEGLMVPVIKAVDTKDIFTLAQEISVLAEKCRDRKIDMQALQGGTFTVTNIGSIGGVFATPIIYPGQTAILGVMRMKEKPVVENTQVVVRPIMSLALSFDHRIVDGADAARFMNEIFLHL